VTVSAPYADLTAEVFVLEGQLRLEQD